ncbi:beta-1,4-galactosyltransferase galt-1-like isoform X3 [Argopecten irradians]|uniref:beta-1,4-galactosyltransferase galt-1-like isoform X3 n=1 Tax=Argopecten irradians TaxID=31199 RepID=UPI00371B3930
MNWKRLLKLTLVLMCIYTFGNAFIVFVRYVQLITNELYECENVVGIDVTSLPRQQWLMVDSARRGDIWYFSAFYTGPDIENPTSRTKIWISGAQNIRMVSESLYCQFWIQHADSTVLTTRVKPALIREHRSLRYAAAYFTCNVPYNMKPVGVSLTTQRCENPSNFLPIQYPDKQKWQFTVCVTPLNFRYSKAYELVEMIEMNRILGADHFVFYNYSTHENVDKVLNYYIDIGLVEVVQWHLPMRVDVWPKVKGHTTEIHYFGQLGSLNDCLYRNRYKSQYLVYQDLDEFIFPYKHKNWSEMIDSLAKRNVYMFRNTFFRKDWNDTDTMFEGKDLAKRYKSTILLKTMREAKIFGLRQRSKYIINPRKVDTVGIHNVWKERSGSSLLNVPPDVALIHHYRDWENPNDKMKREEDPIAFQYKEDLLGRLKKVWTTLKDVKLGPLGF